MDLGTFLQVQIDSFNKLVIDFQTAEINKDEETHACSFLFS